jgi:EAL domain-containing protein (putative c-di-GMP-specific phosphodiesterase class I)
VFQPVVDLMSGRLLGLEALLRWHHPTEGVIFPQFLIPWAEANGEIVAIGAWVIAEGCRQAMAWPASIQLAVNCSIVQLRLGALATAVSAALEGSGMPSDRLTLEVTEHAVSEELAIAELKTIADLGVQLAVDNVGTSWTSFEILQKLEFNTVKIDQAVVNGLGKRDGINRMLVESLVRVAHDWGMSTVAEGVETSLQASIVRELDSDAAQGYFFAPPVDDGTATRVANVADLCFSLEGAGWRNDDDWPFIGAHAEATRTTEATEATESPETTETTISDRSAST